MSQQPSPPKSRMRALLERVVKVAEPTPRKIVRPSGPPAAPKKACCTRPH